jgi:hypothetical protein
MFLEYRAALIMWREGFIEQLAQLELQMRSEMSCANKGGDPGRPWIAPES